MLYIVIPIILCLVAFFVVVVIRDTNRFEISEYDYTDDRFTCERRIVFLSDLHMKEYGDHNELLLSAIERTHPDIVLIGGDMVTTSSRKETKRIAEFIGKLKERYKVVYAAGNHEDRSKLDPVKYGNFYENYERELNEVGVRIINNEVVDYDGVDIVGLTIGREYYRRFKTASMDDDYISSLVGAKREDRVTILLAHNPDYFENYAGYGADIVLSGHVHGGVVRLWGLGGVISPRCTLFPKYDAGRFVKDNSLMILSRGLGMHTIPLRFNNPGELVVLNLKQVARDEVSL